MTPLHFAARYGHLSVVEYLVNQKVDINAKDNYDNTPLHFAAQGICEYYHGGSLSVVEFLVNRKADINAKNRDGWTPLHWAAENDHLSVVKYLVNKNAEINANTNDYDTPLDLAIDKHYHSGIITFLRSKGGSSYHDDEPEKNNDYP